MKKHRHYHFLIFSLLMVMSVFLMSCGIPTLCNLSNIVITPNINDVSFSIKGSDTDLSLVDMGPGLLFSYVIGDSSNPLPELTNTSGLIKTFKDLSDSNSLYINNDNSILKFKAGDNNEYILYAFNNINNIVYKPLYNIDLKSKGFVSNININAQLNLVLKSWQDNIITIEIYDSSNNLIQTIKADISNTPDSNIYIYAAFSAEVGNFSNIYWSDLKYIGTFSSNM